MRKILLIVFLGCQLFGKVEDCFRKINHRMDTHQIKHIDYIYLINLDHQVERYCRSFEQLAAYQIYPHRFSAINGWEMTESQINQVGLKWKSWMNFGPNLNGKGVRFEKNKEKKYRLKDLENGKIIFSEHISKGGIGCALSHLSILQDAYDAGYQTIWILEDDFVLHENPHLLSEYIEKLDQLTDEWDVLYTDENYVSWFDVQESNSADFYKKFPIKWRPDHAIQNYQFLTKREVLNEDFNQIASRFGMYSIIVRRSGMKKILDFIKERGIFLPIDHDISYVPNIKLFVLKKSLVTCLYSSSDTQKK